MTSILKLLAQAITPTGAPTSTPTPTPPPGGADDSLVEKVQDIDIPVGDGQLVEAILPPKQATQLVELKDDIAVEVQEDWTTTLAFIKQVLNFELLTVGDITFTPGTVISFLVFIFLAFQGSKWAQKLVAQALRRAGVKEEGSIGVFSRLSRYAFLLIGISIALETIGVDLGALFAAGAVFAVGIGFAMQNIAQNFVSGLILLLERTIKPGDVLEVDGTVVRVMEMGIRSTVARTRDDEELIIPNAQLVQSTVKNYTFHDSVFRLKALVGVSYDSDLKQVNSVLKETAEAIDFRLKNRDPRILLLDFADSAVVFEVNVWIEDPWLARVHASTLRNAIWWALKDADLVIAYPQIDVHFDPAIEKALASGRGEGGSTSTKL